MSLRAPKKWLFWWGNICLRNTSRLPSDLLDGLLESMLLQLRCCYKGAVTNCLVTNFCMKCMNHIQYSYLHESADSFGISTFRWMCEKSGNRERPTDLHLFTNLYVHWSLLVRSTFCPWKIDLKKKGDLISWLWTVLGSYDWDQAKSDPEARLVNI